MFGSICDDGKNCAGLFGQKEQTRNVFRHKKKNLEDFRIVFQDQLAREDDVYLQIKDESWGGIFVGVLEQEIPDRSIIKATRITPVADHKKKQQDVVNYSYGSPVCHFLLLCIYRPSYPMF